MNQLQPGFQSGKYLFVSVMLSLFNWQLKSGVSVPLNVHLFIMKLLVLSRSFSFPLFLSYLFRAFPLPEELFLVHTSWCRSLLLVDLASSRLLVTPEFVSYSGPATHSYPWVSFSYLLVPLHWNHRYRFLTLREQVKGNKMWGKWSCNCSEQSPQPRSPSCCCWALEGRLHLFMCIRQQINNQNSTVSFNLSICSVQLNTKWSNGNTQGSYGSSQCFAIHQRRKTGSDVPGVENQETEGEIIRWASPNKGTRNSLVEGRGELVNSRLKEYTKDIHAFGFLKLKTIKKIRKEKVVCLLFFKLSLSNFNQGDRWVTNEVW